MDVREVLERDYIDGVEAAELLGLSMIRVRELCQQGRFNGAFKFGRSWIIPRSAVLSFQRLPRGPKPKTPRRADDAALLSSALDEAKGGNTEAAHGADR